MTRYSNATQPRQVKTEPETFNPFYSPKIKGIRVILKAGFVLFFILFSSLTYSSWKNSNYPYPKEEGITHIRGLYNVDEFVINADTLAYSLTDTVRWQNVVFESWNTFSIKRKSAVKADFHKPKIIWQQDSLRSFEYIGNSGREFYRYTFSPIPNKGYQVDATNKRNTVKSFHFQLDASDKNVLLLSGKNEEGDYFKIKLHKVNKEYLLDKGRRKPLSIY